MGLNLCVQLVEAGILSHLPDDHAGGGLFTLLFLSYSLLSGRQPGLYKPDIYTNISDRKALTEHHLSRLFHISSTSSVFLTLSSTSSVSSLQQVLSLSLPSTVSLPCEDGIPDSLTDVNIVFDV